MEADGHKVAVLHSALATVADRDAVIDSFRNRNCKVCHASLGSEFNVMAA